MKRHPDLRASTVPAAILREAGLRATVQRQEVLRALCASSEPLSAGQICRATARDAVDRATVYRVVNSLHASGVIHHAYSIGRASYYELADHCGSDACHPHFTCRLCGVTSCFYDVPVPLASGVPAGYRIERRKLMLLGLCPSCEAKRRKNHAKNASRPRAR